MRLCIYVVPIFFKYGYDMVSSFEGCSGVVLVLDHPLSLISGPVVASVHAPSSLLIVAPIVVLVLDSPSSRFVGSESSCFPVVLVPSFLILVSVCAPNHRPLVHPECHDYFGCLNGHCVRRLILKRL